MSEIHHQLADLLLEVEAELRRLALWQEAMPPREAMQSAVPFCADTLYLHQWLQWIFVPRMKQIVEQDMALPQRCEIAPYAEEYCRQQAVDSAELLSLLRRVDRLINETTQPLRH